MLTTLNVTKEQWLKYHLKIWKGALDMTNKECDIIEYFIKEYQMYKEEGLDPEVIDKLVYSQESYSAMRSLLKLSPQNWNNYKQTMIKKRLLTGTPLKVNEKLLLDSIIEFKFKLK